VGLLVGDHDETIVIELLDGPNRFAQERPALWLGDLNGLDASQAATRRNLDDGVRE
jgi:hypothetical protein